MLPAIFGVYGKSNTGKTSLIVDIVDKLSQEGFKIASIKITDRKIDIDTKGKDSWKFADAGSKLVVIRSKNETDFIIKQKQGIKKIIKQICYIDNFDLILIEGARDKFIPKIRLGNIENRENTILTYSGNFEELIQIIKKEIKRRKNG